ncbi:hypothetical protein [Photorhabdus sp. RW14-46]|uniref:hypothetical protein n=1 Tax=Photorhabdus sp. RW14-46 TaxID=2100168 RepID=UPI0013F41ADD|nr:hypothetical protein [Photorhabdus sp. RW14-46]
MKLPPFLYYTQWISRCIATARERISGSIDNDVTGVSECSQQSKIKTDVKNISIPVPKKKIVHNFIFRKNHSQLCHIWQQICTYKPSINKLMVNFSMTQNR